MANEQNLIPQAHKITLEEQSRGGIKSGEVRRKRKAMKQQMEMLLSLPFNLKDKDGKELKEEIKKLGIDEENIDNQMALIVALWRTALKFGRNQITAIQEIRDIVEDKNENKENNIQRIQIINDLPEDEENGTSQN